MNLKKPEPNLGFMIRAARKKKHITQIALSEMLQFNQSALARIELGKKKPPVELLARIAPLLGLRFKDLAEAMILEDLVTREELMRNEAALSWPQEQIEDRDKFMIGT